MHPPLRKIEVVQGIRDRSPPLEAPSAPKGGTSVAPSAPKGGTSAALRLFKMLLKIWHPPLKKINAV